MKDLKIYKLPSDIVKSLKQKQAVLRAKADALQVDIDSEPQQVETTFLWFKRQGLNPTRSFLIARKFRLVSRIDVINQKERFFADMNAYTPVELSFEQWQEFCDLGPTV